MPNNPLVTIKPEYLTSEPLLIFLFDLFLFSLFYD